MSEQNEPTQNDATQNIDERPDYEREEYERENESFRSGFQRFCDYYGNNRRG